MKLSQDLKPVSYFKNNMAEVIRKLNETHGTMIITQNGEAKAALIDIKAYEDLQETLTMLEMMAQGNKNLTDGQYRSAKQVLKEYSSAGKERTRGIGGQPISITGISTQS